jgi:hypothetical protein
VILLLRAIVRLATFLLLVALAIAGGAVAVFSLGASGDLSLPGLAERAQLPQVRDEVGNFLRALEASGPLAWRSALGGLAAVAAGALLLIGALWPRRERLVILDRTDAGTVAARRRALSRAAGTLVGQLRGVRVRRASARPHRRQPGGRLILRVSHPLSVAAKQVEARAAAALEPLTEPFPLRPSVRAKSKGRVE